MQRHIKELVRRSALHVMDGGGVVRGFRYWGLMTLPQTTHKQKAIHTHGEYVPRTYYKTTGVILNGIVAIGLCILTLRRTTNEDCSAF